jgi:hypothetical protein
MVIEQGALVLNLVIRDEDLESLEKKEKDWNMLWVLECQAWTQKFWLMGEEQHEYLKTPTFNSLGYGW